MLFRKLNLFDLYEMKLVGIMYYIENDFVKKVKTYGGHDRFNLGISDFEKWGRWKVWKVYYPTILIFIAGDFIHGYIEAAKPLWRFVPDPLFFKTPALY
jgi:hypothetical protein